MEEKLVRQGFRSVYGGGILLFCAVALFGCKKDYEVTMLPHEHIPTAKLLKTPLSKLHPTPIYRKGSHATVELNNATHLRFSFSQSKKRYDFYSENKKWWVIETLSKDTARGAWLDAPSVDGLLSGLKKLRPLLADDKKPKKSKKKKGKKKRKKKKTRKSYDRMQIAPLLSELQLDKAAAEFSLFNGQGSFLLRAMQMPERAKARSLFAGQWLVYHEGVLYKQKAGGQLSEAMSNVKRALRRLARRGEWLGLPMHTNHLDYKEVRSWAKQLQAFRLSLGKKCFRKKRIPGHLGTVTLQLKFDHAGKVTYRRHIGQNRKTRALQKKHRPFWCVWIWVKRWQLKGKKLAPFEYHLNIPPGGPRK